MTDLEQQLTDHLRERAAAATPHYDLEAVEAGMSHYAPVDLDERRRRRLLIPAVVGVAAAVALVVAIAVVREAQDRDTSTPVTEPDQGPTTTFVSPRHGFSVEYPDGGVVTPATQFFWVPATRNAGQRRRRCRGDRLGRRLHGRVDGGPGAGYPQ